MNRKILLITGIVSLAAFGLFAIVFLAAWVGILILWLAGVAGLVTIFLRRSKAGSFTASPPQLIEAPPKKELNELAAYLQRTREEEKLALSREIHDELGQLLTALRMDIAWLDRGIRSDQSHLRHKVNDMIEVIDRTIKIVQKICTDLRPSILDDFGLVPALQWQAKDFEKYTRVPVTMEIWKEDIPMDQEDATVLFRVFQEALINIGRYAKANRVDVKLRQNGDTLILRIRDNGIGIPEEKIEDPHSFGIMTMRQRLLSRGGRLLIKGERNRGTVVEATLRIKHKETAYEDSHRR